MISYTRGNHYYVLWRFFTNVTRDDCHHVTWDDRDHVLSTISSCVTWWLRRDLLWDVVQGWNFSGLSIRARRLIATVSDATHRLSGWTWPWRSLCHRSDWLLPEHQLCIVMNNKRIPLHKRLWHSQVQRATIRMLLLLFHWLAVLLILGRRLEWTTKMCLTKLISILSKSITSTNSLREFLNKPVRSYRNVSGGLAIVHATREERKFLSLDSSHSGSARRQSRNVLRLSMPHAKRNGLSPAFGVFRSLQVYLDKAEMCETVHAACEGEKKSCLGCWDVWRRMEIQQKCVRLYVSRVKSIGILLWVLRCLKTSRYIAGMCSNVCATREQHEIHMSVPCKTSTV